MKRGRLSIIIIALMICLILKSILLQKEQQKENESNDIFSDF